MATKTPIRLGTRASDLARWQADWTARRLGELGAKIKPVYVTTQGDIRREAIGEIGGFGVFTKELQRALLAGEIDLAVHSLKDLPTEPVPGLKLAAVPERGSIGDVLVCREADGLENLPAGARVGTGSLRRQAQLLYLRPDLRMLDIRGNVDTRLRKLDEGHYDAIVLAEAGVRRLGLAERITQLLACQQMLPAVGQGALGLEARTEDAATLELLGPLNDAATYSAVLAERAMLATLRGGCLAPVGAWGRFDGDRLRLDGVVLSGDGTQRVAASASGPAEQAQAIGREVAEQLLAQGAGELIAGSRAAGP